MSTNYEVPHCATPEYQYRLLNIVVPKSNTHIKFPKVDCLAQKLMFVSGVD
jgi:hypothetical protein